MKHRTQILMENWQYEALRAEAARLKVSFSFLIRKGIDYLLQAHRSEKKSKHQLKAFAGIIREKRAPLSNTAMDQIIYDKDWD